MIYQNRDGGPGGQLPLHVPSMFTALLSGLLLQQEVYLILWYIPTGFSYRVFEMVLFFQLRNFNFSPLNLQLSKVAETQKF